MMTRPLMLACGLAVLMLLAWGWALVPTDPLPSRVAARVALAPLPGPEVVLVGGPGRQAPLYEETLGEVADLRHRLDALLDSPLAETHPGLLLYARDRFQCWAAGDAGRFATCRAQTLAALARLERLEDAATPLVLAGGL
ncbi:hypothetical protein [Roseospirillum parvum]|uniref:Uncharacterized protein n=1 Tax=Roseospirillum parvum TaxID=83401 RepID=A0A1G7ZFU3_9PROT|nr:hypothetical protein [Roseospirillum parvum]SDH07643.1 hypothetical protein SAMN05421742_10499 [Roseospirillum parvum]